MYGILEYIQHVLISEWCQTENDLLIRFSKFTHFLVKINNINSNKNWYTRCKAVKPLFYHEEKFRVGDLNFLSIFFTLFYFWDQSYKANFGIDNIKNGFNTLNLTIKSANMCLLIVKKLKKSKKAQPENIILHKF